MMTPYSNIISLLEILEDNEPLIKNGDFRLQFSNTDFVTLDFIEADKCQTFLDILNKIDLEGFISSINYRSDVPHLVSLELDRGVWQ